MCRTSGSSWLRGTSSYWNNLPINLILYYMLFSFSQTQGDHQGDQFWRHGGHNNKAKVHPMRILPAVHRSVAEIDWGALDQWELIWRKNYIICNWNKLWYTSFCNKRYLWILYTDIRRLGICILLMKLTLIILKRVGIEKCFIARKQHWINFSFRS